MNSEQSNQLPPPPDDTLPLTAFAEDKKVSFNFLTTGDHIAYNNTIYKVNGHLKKGRLKIEDLGSGYQFILSRTDGLYQSLLAARQSQAPLTVGAVPESENHHQLKR